MFAAIAVSLLLLGTDASVADTFVVDLPVSRIAGAIQANPTGLMASSGCRLIWRQGNLIRVGKQTGRRFVDVTLRETVLRTGEVYDYTAVLVRCWQGGVRDYRLQCRIQPYSPTAASVWISAYVDMDAPLRSRAEIIAGLNSGVKAARRYMESLQTAGRPYGQSNNPAH